MSRTPLIAGLELEPRLLRLSKARLYFAKPLVVVDSRPLRSNWSVIQARLTSVGLTSTLRRTAKGRVVIVLTAESSEDELVMRIANALQSKRLAEMFYNDLGWIPKSSSERERQHLWQSMHPQKLFGARRNFAKQAKTAQVAVLVGAVAVTSIVAFAFSASRGEQKPVWAKAEASLRATSENRVETTTTDVKRSMNLVTVRTLLARGLASLGNRKFDADVALDAFMSAGYDAELKSVILLGGEAQLVFATQANSSPLRAVCALESGKWALVSLSRS